MLCGRVSMLVNSMSVGCCVTIVIVIIVVIGIKPLRFGLS